MVEPWLNGLIDGMFGYISSLVVLPKKYLFIESKSTEMAY